MLPMLSTLSIKCEDHYPLPTGKDKKVVGLMKDELGGKIMTDIKLVTTDRGRNRLVSEPNYHATKWFSEKLLAIEMKKAKVKMNKPIYLALSILDISKTLMYEF